MGVLRGALTLSSTDVLSIPVNLSVDAAFIADAGYIMRAKVAHTGGAGSAALVVHKADDKLESSYLYVKNMQGEKEQYIYLYQDTDNNDVFAKLAGGEFCFMPVAVNKTIKAYATKVDSMIEFAVFGLDSSATTLA